MSSFCVEPLFQFCEQLKAKLGMVLGENETGDINVKCNISCLVDPYGFEP